MAEADSKPGFFHPAILLSTWFGCGLLPIAPGTWGSLAALPIGWLIALYGGDAGVIVFAAAAIFILGCAVSDVAARLSGEVDPRWIVIDEVAGQLLTLAAVPRGWTWYVLAFLLFRIFDIVKPFPIRQIERALKGGIGIMADDIGAAVYAVILLLIAERFLG